MTNLSLLQTVFEQPLAGAVAVFDPPGADEHDPYYARYISRVPAGDFAATLRKQVGEVQDLFGALTPAQADFTYAPGKWTIKEVLGHLIDTERVFSYRAAHVGRRDPSPLPGFDQDQWAPTGDFSRRALSDLLVQWSVGRASTLVLVEGLPADAPLQRGKASDMEITCRALLHTIPGHVDYHLQILRERYIGAEGWPS
jgi:hypothetical protein